MKFAYLIIVHTRFDQVAKLLELLDDEKNDLYVHIDEKVADSFEIFQRTLKPSVQKSKIYLVNPHNITWGGKSLIEAELELLKAAIKGNYDYYHLISGMDLPIKTQKEIHEFFENNKGKNNLYSYIIDDYHANMRDIDWKRGRPYTWRNTDFDELMASDYLFARKFDEQIDDQIVYKIYMRLKSK